MDDIPQAVRERVPIKKQSPKKVKSSKFAKKRFLSLVLLCTGGLLFYLGWLLGSNSSTPIQSAKVVNKEKAQQEDTSQQVDNILGHLKYSEAPASDLKSITPDGQAKLRTAAANKFLAMQAAAKSEGINLSVISAFRSIQEQNRLFFKVKEERGQTATKRAQVSAPPGRSEHHTGYAIDIGDAQEPATNLEQTFENTAAYRWLEQNAARYSFEMSFSKNNLQGVSYEPWHWRFVGDTNSLETFYQAKNLQQSLERNP
jgi:D-alanyl-D-alanine carboxypeptidase